MGVNFGGKKNDLSGFFFQIFLCHRIVHVFSFQKKIKFQRHSIKKMRKKLKTLKNRFFEKVFPKFFYDNADI